MLGGVEITSFGYLHGEPPEAHLTMDLRQHFRDPHVSPELRYMTAQDAAVRDAVLATPGITDLVEATARAVEAFIAGPSAGVVMVAVGCAGGRHRAATFGMALVDRLSVAGCATRLVHRDMGRPVVQR